MPPQGRAALATGVGADVVVEAMGGARLVELVVERATRVVVGPAPVRPAGLPPQQDTTRPSAAQSTEARAARIDTRFGPAVVISPPEAA